MKPKQEGNCLFHCRRIGPEFDSPDMRTPPPKVDTPEPGARLLYEEERQHPYRSVDGAVTEQFATPYKEPPLQADRWVGHNFKI